MITINLPGKPIHLERHRTTTRRGKTWEFDSQKKQKAATQMMMYKQVGARNPRLIDYDNYTVTFVFTFYKACVSAYKDGWGFEHPHTQKPDIDNLVKFYLDCGNGIIWSDDAKIDRVNAIKIFGKENNTEMHIMGKKTHKFSPLAELVMKNLSTADIDDLSKYTQVLVDFSVDTCDYTAAEEAEKIASTLHRIADRFAEPLMKIKKGGKNVT